MKRRVVLLVGGVAERAGELSSFFASQGIDVIAAEGGVDAFKMSWQFGIDALVVDMRLPDMTVTEFLAKMAKLAERFSVGVFLIADDQQWEDVVSSLPQRDWPSGHIKLPATPFEILYTITGREQAVADVRSGNLGLGDGPEGAVGSARGGGGGEKFPSAGDLEQHPPERLLVSLGRGRFSGVVMFSCGDKHLRLELTMGQLRAYVARGMGSVNILDLALELGLISAHAHRKISRLSEVRKTPAVQLLLELGELTGEDLESAYRIQGVRKMQTVFGSDWRDGKFNVEPGKTLGADGKPANVNLGKLIVDGLMVYGDGDRIEEFFEEYGETAFVRNYRTPFALNDLSLSESKTDLLMSVDGRTPLSELTLGGYEDAQTKPFLYALWIMDFIKPAGKEEGGSM